MFDQNRFNARIEQYKDASTRKIEADPMRHLIEGGDLSAWGLGNAITRSAQDVDSYDRATELEAVGGKVIELSPSEWRSVQSV
jgi:hypothetical protein